MIGDFMAAQSQVSGHGLRPSDRGLPHADQRYRNVTQVTVAKSLNEAAVNGTKVWCDRGNSCARQHPLAEGRPAAQNHYAIKLKRCRAWGRTTA
jgi:hypothetical protein